MPYATEDTIVAIASARGGAARGIVRLSGSSLKQCLDRIFQADHAPAGQTERPTVHTGRLRLAHLEREIPCELYFWPGRRSYTGEPAAEFHTLGSPPLLDAVVRACCAAGARGAEPGEFTLRAFLAGRLDLTQAEAVLGVIDAADPQQLHAALAQLAGGLAAPLGQLREQLLDLLAHIEAGFDFADEDLPFLTPRQLDLSLAQSLRTIQSIARQMESRAETAPRVRVVILGRPNTGKSSLFNALADRSALVSDQPGTTRDYLTADLEVEGARCVLVDTAGLQDAAAVAPVEVQAQSATAEQDHAAQVKIVCLDTSRAWDAWEQLQFSQPADHLVVLTKIDRDLGHEAGTAAVRTSSLTGEGIATLRARIGQAVRAAAPPADVVAGTALRCHESLGRAADDLRRGAEVHALGGGEELIAAEIRSALDELGQVVGAVYTEDLLDRIFSRFCIGK